MLSQALFRAEPGRGDRIPRPAPGIWLLGLATGIARHVTGRWPGFGSRPYSFGVTGSYYFEGDQVRAARARDDAHLRRPAGGREHVAGGAQVCGGEARAEPEPYLLTVGRGGGRQDERQLAAPRLDPGVHAARSDPVRRDEAPGPCDAPLAAWVVAARRRPPPAVTASPRRPNSLAMNPEGAARAARMPSSQRQFQASSAGPGRRTCRTAVSRLDIRLGSFGPRGRPAAIRGLRCTGSRAVRDRGWPALCRARRGGSRGCAAVRRTVRPGTGEPARRIAR